VRFAATSWEHAGNTIDLYPLVALNDLAAFFREATDALRVAELVAVITVVVGVDVISALALEKSREASI
jgi:hypothetical protein